MTPVTTTMSARAQWIYDMMHSWDYVLLNPANHTGMGLVAMAVGAGMLGLAAVMVWRSLTGYSR